MGRARGKSKMSRIWKLNIALAPRRRTSSTSTRVREVGQGVTKRSRVSDLAENKLSSYLHVVSLIQLHENPQNLIGLKELIQCQYNAYSLTVLYLHGKLPSGLPSSLAG